MLVTILRTVILYLLVSVCVRLMGKRQIGQLQPNELVVTILLSEIAAIPMQDNEIPLLNSVIPLLLLVAFEIIGSVLSLKNVRFRFFSEGNPLFVIRDGKLDQNQLRRLRLSADDILAALRQKDVFDITDVQYAIMETNGTLSILLKPESRPLTPQDMNRKPADNGVPCAVILDGRILQENFAECGADMKTIERLLKKENTPQKNVLMMLLDKSGKRTVIKKERAENSPPGRKGRKKG